MGTSIEAHCFHGNFCASLMVCLRRFHGDFVETLMGLPRKHTAVSMESFMGLPWKHGASMDSSLVLPWYFHGLRGVPVRMSKGLLWQHGASMEFVLARYMVLPPLSMGFPSEFHATYRGTYRGIPWNRGVPMGSCMVLLALLL